jgi:ribonuclease J
MIPGNEKSIFALQSMLEYKDVHVVTTKDDIKIHVSGHAYEGDLVQMLTLLRPKFYLPVHGTYSHLEANAMLSKLCNYTNKTTTIISNGDFLALRGGKISCKGQLDIEQLYVDSESSVPMSEEVLRQRLRIGELGGVVLSGVYSRRHKRFIHGPDLALQGLELPGQLSNEAILQKCQTQLQEQLKLWTKARPFDADTLSEQGRLMVSQFMYLLLRKKPVVISKFYVLG